MSFFCCQTATEIKVKSDAQNEPILLVITATRQENLSEVQNKVSKTVKVVSIFCFKIVKKKKLIKNQKTKTNKLDFKTVDKKF